SRVGCRARHPARARLPRVRAARRGGGRRARPRRSAGGCGPAGVVRRGGLSALSGYLGGVDESDGTQRGGRGGIQSLHRAFDILGFVGRFDVVGATRIAKELGLSVSTVNNLCRTMV